MRERERELHSLPSHLLLSFFESPFLSLRRRAVPFVPGLPFIFPVIGKRGGLDWKKWAWGKKKGEGKKRRKNRPQEGKEN